MSLRNNILIENFSQLFTFIPYFVHENIFEKDTDDLFLFDDCALI